MKRSTLFVLVVGALLSVAALAFAKVSRAGDALVRFTASGPAGLSIVGTTNELTLRETEQEFVVVVPLRNLDTKIGLRNAHMRDKYLEVEKFPNAVLRVSKAQIQRGTTSRQATGVLSLHGKSKSTPFTYTATPAGDVSGALHLNVKDFDITQPGYAGVSVKPDVDVDVTFHITTDAS